MSTPASERPAAPRFGEPLPVAASPQTIAFLERRRSASALTLSAPGPSMAEVERILAIAARAPDHGKLFPWRFVILQDAAKAGFVAGLERIAAARQDGGKALAKLGKIKSPPLTIAVVSRAFAGEIPEWEQRLSAGAVCTLMILAAQALGYGANWITDWYAYDADANALLGLEQSELVAGFVHIGRTNEDPLERVRPDARALTTTWTSARDRG